MSGAELQKSWRVSETLLMRARRALPAPPLESKDEFDRCIREFEDFLSHNEFGLALDAVEAAGNLALSGGGFWRDFERAAENMSLGARAQQFRERFAEAQKR
jgi:hypothetical protein